MEKMVMNRLVIQGFGVRSMNPIRDVQKIGLNWTEL